MLRHIEHLSQFDRVMCSDGYDRALDYVAAHVHCPAAWVSRDVFPAGHAFWGWQVPATLSHWRDQRADPIVRIPNDRPMAVLHVRIPGRSAREILFVSHVCHPAPSANDNASGPAMMMELINYYADHQPDLTLRFLFTVEYWGTVAYCERHQSTLTSVIAGASIDMVGANQDVCGSTMVVDEIPDHLASCFDLVLWNRLQDCARAGQYRGIGNPVMAFRCDFQYFTGGSDHYILNDSSIGIPSTVVNTYPDRFHHTPDDTIDKISPETLRLFFVTIVDGIADFGDASDAGGRHLAQLALHRYEQVTSGQLLTMSVDALAPAESTFRLTHSYRHAAARLHSMERLHSAESVAPWLDVLEERFRQRQREFTLCTGRAFESSNITDRYRCQKLFKGPLSRNALYQQIAPADKARLMDQLNQDSLFFHKVDAALNYASDRGLTEIALLLRLHYGGESYEPTLAWVFELLERSGLVRIAQS